MSHACEGSEPDPDDGRALREAKEDRDTICDLELSAERMKITALRLRAVVLAARAFAPADEFHGYRQKVLLDALKDLDWHDAHHGAWVHIDEARRRGLPTYGGGHPHGYGWCGMCRTNHDGPECRLEPGDVGTGPKGEL
jgi:hypothetical protein